MILLRLADCCITPAVVTKAQSGFDKVIYTTTVGIQAYVCELERISKHILLPINEYTLETARKVNNEDAEQLANSILGHLYRDPEGKCLAESMNIEWSEADDGCNNTASIPIVIRDKQMVQLPEKMLKSISELNYETLLITGEPWFKYHLRMNIMVLGGQVHGSMNNNY